MRARSLAFYARLFEAKKKSIFTKKLDKRISKIQMMIKATCKMAY
jgi:hypothetical protein